MPQTVSKIACVNASGAEIQFLVQKKGSNNDDDKSPLSAKFSLGQFIVIDLVPLSRLHTDDLEIKVEQTVVPATFISNATVQFFQTRRPENANVATYVVSGTAGALTVTLAM